MKHLEENYDIVVVGAGHAGCEAAFEFPFPPRCDPPCSPVSPDATVPHPQRKNAPHGW